jgi:hypothetical protein
MNLEGELLGHGEAAFLVSVQISISVMQKNVPLFFMFFIKEPTTADSQQVHGSDDYHEAQFSSGGEDTCLPTRGLGCTRVRVTVPRSLPLPRSHLSHAEWGRSFAVLMSEFERLKFKGLLHIVF